MWTRDPRLGMRAPASAAKAASRAAAGLPRTSAWPMAAAILAALLFVSGSAPAEAQEFDREVGEAIGRLIAVGVVLASDDFAAGGRYTFDDGSGEFRVRHLGGRRRFRRSSRWQPFVGLEIGEMKDDEKLDLGPAGLVPASLQVRGFGIEAGTRVELGGDWFGEVLLGIGYAFVENRLRYPDPETEAVLGPVLDGVIFNWDAEALALEGGLLLAWDHQSDALRTILQGEVVGLRTNPVSVDHPIQDVTIDTHFERLKAAFEIPLGLSIFDRPLSALPSVQYTLLGTDLEKPLETDDFTNIRLAIVAQWPAESRLPISGLGISVRYTQADTFDGWSVGVSLGH